MNKENIRVWLCKIKTIKSLRNCFKSCTEYILFNQIFFHLGLPKYRKIIKLKVNFVHFIDLLTDNNKQTYYLLALSYKRFTNSNKN